MLIASNELIVQRIICIHAEVRPLYLLRLGLEHVIGAIESLGEEFRQPLILGVRDAEDLHDLGKYIDKTGVFFCHYE